MLKDLDSPLDLMLRGFDREAVTSATGVDIGYNGRGLRQVAAGIDRFAYKVEHVRARVPDAVVRQALQKYAGGASKVEVLAHLGLAGENIVKLKALFAELGHQDTFEQADRAARRANMVSGFAAKHGVDNPFKLPQMQDRARRTRLQRYGGEYTLSATSSLSAAARETFRTRLEDPAFKEAMLTKRRATTLDRFGVEHPMLSQEIKTKLRSYVQDVYGVDHWAQTVDARIDQARRMAVVDEHGVTEGRRRAILSRKTFRSRYGLEFWSQTEEARQAQSVRMRDPEHQAKVVEIKRRRGTFSTSKPEEELYALLVLTFGVDDVERQYRLDERYPWACDFYIKSRDMFIEYNGLWTHGGHWFDPDRPEDRACAQKWGAKNTAFYDAAIEQWCVRDVMKRKAAAEGDLNYVVFWGDNRLDDARLWLAMGAPDGKDWDQEHSWLPRPELTEPASWPALGDAPRRAISIARKANWAQFYRRELALWSAQYASRHGSLAGRLFSNRYAYLGKLPSELSTSAILRGMGVSGIVRKFTVFDNTAMKAVLHTYAPQYIYDPCAGWGERLVTAAALGVRYTGVDINVSVVAGHQRILEHYGLTEQSSQTGDAALFDARSLDHDMVFTCPPYGSIEIYTDVGAENLSEEDFIGWWRQVVTMAVGARTKVFAYQINQRYKIAMNQVLLEAGWVLVDQVPLDGSVSHFNRGKGGRVRKSEFEEVQVFQRP